MSAQMDTKLTVDGSAKRRCISGNLIPTVQSQLTTTQCRQNASSLAARKIENTKYFEAPKILNFKAWLLDAGLLGAGYAA